MNSVELRQTRERIGLNTKQMAKALKMSHRTYQGWECGRTIPAVGSTAVELLELMGGVHREFWLQETGAKR